MVISINIDRYIIVDEEFIADKYIEQTGWCIDPLGTPFSIYKPEIYAGTSMPLLPDRTSSNQIMFLTQLKVKYLYSRYVITLASVHDGAPNKLHLGPYDYSYNSWLIAELHSVIYLHIRFSRPTELKFKL